MIMLKVQYVRGMGWKATSGMELYKRGSMLAHNGLTAFSIRMSSRKILKTAFSS